MVPAQPQLGQEAAPIFEVVILYLTGAGEDLELLFYHPGQFQWKEPTILRLVFKGDQPLVMREPKTAIVMPDITRTLTMPDIIRTLTDFQTFAAEHNISLVRINIQALIDEMGKRGRLLSGDATGATRCGLSSKLGDGRISARAHSSNDSFSFLLWKYRVGIYFHILHLQVFTRDDSQNHEVDLGKEIQFSHSVTLIVINKFIAKRRNKQ